MSPPSILTTLHIVFEAEGQLNIFAREHNVRSMIGMKVFSLVTVLLILKVNIILLIENHISLLLVQLYYSYKRICSKNWCNYSKTIPCICNYMYTIYVVYTAYMVYIWYIHVHVYLIRGMYGIYIWYTWYIYSLYRVSVVNLKKTAKMSRSYVLCEKKKKQSFVRRA